MPFTLPSWAPSSLNLSELQPGQLPTDPITGLAQDNGGLSTAYNYAGLPKGASLSGWGIGQTGGGAQGYYSLTIPTSTGGTQTVRYNPQGQPIDVQGLSPDTGSLADALIKAGAIGGGLAITGGGAAGLLGPSAAGPGAAALGGSADAAGTAGVAGAAAAPSAGSMAFDPSGMADQIAGTSAQNVAPSLQGDLSAAISQYGPGSAAANALGAGLTSNQLSLARGLLNLGKNVLTQPQVGGSRVGGTSGAPTSIGGGMGAGIGGLSDNLKMMLESNAQARMNGQPLPFPGMGGMGT